MNSRPLGLSFSSETGRCTAARVNRPHVRCRRIKMAKVTFKPGQRAGSSGQYGVVGPRGGKLPYEVTIVSGKPFPPTVKPGQTYVQVDPTKHRSAK